MDALEEIKTNQADCIVGLPIQVLSLAKLKNTDPRYSDLKLKSILLSADYVPETLRHTISTAFDCPVYTHYGMTEMGYGGGVECSALNGYHMRDVDLYTEIINPITGEAVSDGTYGEVVFTTLGREGMPLIRYRTGDIARILPSNCYCSKVFKRMDYVQGRFSERLPLQNGNYLTIGMLDEILFQLDNVLDYRASFETKGDSILLHIAVKPVNQKTGINPNEIETMIRKNPMFASLLANHNIILTFDGYINDIEVSNGMVKRRLGKKQQGQGKIA
jgi:phenylacetate-coenzyme A ligase PaaK-like adenylate-forming protein